MKMYRLPILLTLLNLGVLLFQLARMSPPVAAESVGASVLRGSALEIVDPQGRVRASVKVQPPGSMNGEAYPETVVLRLVDPDGRPSVKLAGSDVGAGLSLLGDADSTYLLLNAQGTESSLKLISDGRQQLVKP